MTDLKPPPVDVAGFRSDFHRLVTAVGSVILGKDEQVRDAVLCLLAEGHLLIEDVPGVGKTSLARALAAAIGGAWNRVQFTADLMPSDITGVAVFDQREADFHFRAGPVFTHVLVADEINRASPKAQSALLEVMAERTVTVDGQTYAVPEPFLVIATQNPVDMDGTYPLPEAQLDRFMMRIRLGLPGPDAELAVLAADRAARNGPPEPDPVLTPKQVVRHLATARSVEVSDATAAYIIRLATAVRRHPDTLLGVSTRATVMLQRLAQARAAASGRHFVTPDDVQPLVAKVFPHRILLTPEAEARGGTPEALVDAVTTTVPAPRPPS